MVRKILALSALLAVPASAQTTIETISFWDGASDIEPFGKPNSATYGQTFTVPATDNVLQSFSFFLRDFSSASELVFQGYVAAWDPATMVLTGPLLFQSSLRSGPTTTTFTRYDFDVGGVPLTTGGTYVAFLSVSGFFNNIPVTDALSAWGNMQTSNMNPYPGGAFVVSNSGDSFSDLSTFAWGVQTSDLAFEVVLGETPTVIPEPSTVLLMGTGMGLLLLGVARRKRRT